MWTMFNRDDDTTYPPPNTPLFVAYTDEDGEKYMKAGTYLETCFGYSWVVEEDADPDAFVKDVISSKRVVAWIAMPEEFPE